MKYYSYHSPFGAKNQAQAPQNCQLNRPISRGLASEHAKLRRYAKESNKKVCRSESTPQGCCTGTWLSPAVITKFVDFFCVGYNFFMTS